MRDFPEIQCHAAGTFRNLAAEDQSQVHVHVFSRKNDCLGCAVLLCLVCLFDLACFFLSSFSSLI